MQALILAGGSGTRFWPASRRSRPKQFLPMAGERSLLQITVDRLDPLVAPEAIWVCTTENLVDAVIEQLPEVPRQQILAEPQGRNTAPAIGWALSKMPPAAQQDVVAVLPADHFIAAPVLFRETLERAGQIAGSDRRIMTLGVQPTRAETGYGYLELGELIDAASGLRQVARFTEKPDQATAVRFVDTGNYLWNAGMFVFPGSLLVEVMGKLQPELAAGLAEIARQPERRGEIYAGLPSISIDHAVMEKLTDLATLPLDCGWTDLGSWEALWELLAGDDKGNVVHGEGLTIDAADNLLYADSGMVSVLGVEGLVVVKTEDAVLVIPKARSQEVRRIIAELRKRQRDVLL